MKSYLFIGSKYLINYYFNDIIDGKVAIIDFLGDNYYTYDSSYNLKNKYTILNKEYEIYNCNLEDEFYTILTKFKPTDIVFGLYTGIEKINVFKFLEYISKYNLKYKINLICLFPFYVYNVIPLKIYFDTFKKLIKYYKINTTIYIHGIVLGKNLTNSLIEKRIKFLYNNIDLPFPNYKYRELIPSNFIHMLDLKQIIMLTLKNMDNKINSFEIFNLCNNGDFTLERVDKIISDYMKITLSNKINYSKLKKSKINEKIQKNYSYSFCMNLDDSIIDTLTWYNDTHLIKKELTKEDKDYINKLTKEEKRTYLRKLNQNKLLNKDIINYLKSKIEM